MIKNDFWIHNQAINGLITPFIDGLIREFNSVKCLSYGLSSYGYDIRLSPNAFKILKHIPGDIIDVKSINLDNFTSVSLQSDRNGEFFVIPANSYGLGVSLEYIRMPSNVTAICMGKSTYARAGLICNTTPLEAGWCGHITLEFSNSSKTDVRIYANEGVCQLLFFEGDPCNVSYRDRSGKYQNQNHEITLPIV